MSSLEILSSRLDDRHSDLDLPLCVTCSTQTSYRGDDLDCQASDAAYKCPICLDPRQFIGIEGQKWTTLRTLIKSGNYHNDFHELVAGQVWTFKTRPSFGIGQRAFLLKTAQGLVMWDCVAYLDDATLQEIDRISGESGLSHMVVSHPHYYSTTATWLAAFPHMTLWLAQEDFDEWYQRRELVQRLPPRIRLVEREQVQTDVGPQVKILLLGGHFPGSLVLLFQDMLFIADTIQVVPSGRYQSHRPQRPDVVSVSFLWSYPNQIPLSAAEIERVCAPLESVAFDKAFGAFEGFDIWGHAKEKILQSRDIFCRRLLATSSA